MMTEIRSPQNRRLDGQVAIVTGGASGIGKGTCIALAREGACLAVVDLDSERIEDVIAELAHLNTDTADAEAFIPLALSVQEEQDMADMVTRTLDHFGRVDLLVHCAGILRAAGSGPKLMHQVTPEEWESVIDTNLKGTFLSNRAVLPTMMEQRSGQIINISSTSGLKGRAFDSVYCASKFGVIGLSESLAEEVRQFGIRVHVIMPDAVDTPMWDQNKPVKAPPNSLSPERVSDLICYIAGLPGDTVLGNVVIFPFRTRRRRKEKS